MKSSNVSFLIKPESTSVKTLQSIEGICHLPPIIFWTSFIVPIYGEAIHNLFFTLSHLLRSISICSCSVSKFLYNFKDFCTIYSKELALCYTSFLPFTMIPLRFINCLDRKYHLIMNNLSHVNRSLYIHVMRHFNAYF